MKTRVLRENRLVSQEEFAARSAQVCSTIPGFAEYNPTAIEPLHDRILVKRLADDYICSTSSKSRIVAPDCARGKARLAVVLKVGPGAWRDGEFCKTAVKPGDVVILPGIAAVIPDWELHDQILIQEGDVGAILGRRAGPQA